MPSNYQVSTDVKEALAMAETLASYVRGDQLYGNAGGNFFSNMPSLTVGALLLRLRRLDALRANLNESQLEDLSRAVQLYDETRKEWTLHYEEKMLQEANSRLASMDQFFKECQQSAVTCANVYRPELLRRTIVQEIVQEMSDMRLSDEDLLKKLKSTDAKLRGVLHDDEFQWDAQLSQVYPKDEFWWLYQKPLSPAE